MKLINSNEEMLKRYKKAFDREDEEKAGGLCLYLCAHVARHNLLADKDTFSKRFLDFCTFTKENRKRFQESQKSLIDDLINEAQIDLKYYIDEALQSLKAAPQKLDEIQKK